MGETKALTPAEIAHLRELEQSMWIAATRYDAAYMARTLSPDFFEFGCSGRVYARDETLAIPAQAEIRATLPLRDFQVHPITEDVVQVTYISEVMYATAQVCNRSSIWVRTSEGWRLRFHQGTPLPTETG